MNVREATVHPRATENIDEIIDIISTLVEKGYAYPVSNGDVYFSPSKFKEYGKLSHQPLEDLEAGARINVEELKRAHGLCTLEGRKAGRAVLGVTLG